MKLILKVRRKLKYHTKEIFKITKIWIIALLIIYGLILIKYKPLYKVQLENYEVGYVKDKNEFNSQIKEYVDNKEEKVAFITLEAEPQYKFELVSNKLQTNEEEIFQNIKDNSVIMYTAYGIQLNEDTKAYVKNEEDAENIANVLKEKYASYNEIDISVKQIYTEENPETIGQEEAIAKVTEIANAQIKENERKSALAVVNDVIIAAKPVSGIITSRYGESSNIRSSNHTGLDIAASTGMPIYACSSGTVIYAADSNGSYGKVVKIKHDNGVETWYAHCSQIYVSSGQTVKAGDKIAAVGSTGNSTGPHLHFEIRINGSTVNPQKYLYK